MPRMTRRPDLATRFLWRLGGGLGGIALAHLLGRGGPARRAGRGAGRGPSSTAGCTIRRRSAGSIQLFMNGGVSQMDTFDYKPELDAAARPDVRPGRARRGRRRARRAS